MPDAPIASLQNLRVKAAVKLRQRAHRDAQGLFIVEGFSELKRALVNGRRVITLFVCPELFLGENEPELIEQCRHSGAEIVSCTPPVFEKMAYRERPEGLLAILPQVHLGLADLQLPPQPLLIVAEKIEKPGNLGTILRSADAAGATAVIVCDRCTDIHNPNVVRASIGTLFTLPVVETSSAEALAWLRLHKIRILAASPHAERDYTQVDLRPGTAIVVGAEQYGLSSGWLAAADMKVRIAMHGQADSLNVAAATTILLFEAVRQRTKV
ncbi:MAG: RNA methyltransferase [Lentisphaerae bacterium]|nr:RNA methyltransferase [Lentisphaerota bacterium]